MKSPTSFGKLRRPKLKPPLIVRRVQGHSMVPVLPPGTTIWAVRWFRRLAPGDVVVLIHNDKEKVKRIDQIDGERIFVLGDHAETSTDSRHFGWLGRDVVVAKLVWPAVPKTRASG